MADQLIDRTGAIAAGYTGREIDDRMRSLKWFRLFPAVYCSGPPPESPIALTTLFHRAALLWAGPDAILGAASAAWWMRLLPSPPVIVEIIVPPHRQLSSQPGVRTERAALDPADVVRIRGVQVTARERTALDLAARGCTDLLDLMIRKGWFDDDRLAEALHRGTGRRGWTKARQAVAESATRPFSALERRFHRELHRAGLTGWTANVELRLGGRTVIPDLLFAQERLVVEIDSHTHHSDRAAFERDRIRQNLLTTAGYTVLRFTWAQLVTNPAGVMAQIRAALSMQRRSR